MSSQKNLKSKVKTDHSSGKSFKQKAGTPSDKTRGKSTLSDNTECIPHSSRTNHHLTPDKQRETCFVPSSQTEHKNTTVISNADDFSLRLQCAYLEQGTQLRPHILSRFKTRFFQESHKLLFLTSALMISYPLYKSLSLLQKPVSVNIAIFIIVYFPVCVVIKYVFCRHYCLRSPSILPSAMPATTSSQLNVLQSSDSYRARQAEINDQLRTTELRQVVIDKERTLYPDSARVADTNGDVMATELRQVGIDKERTLYTDSARVADINGDVMPTKLRQFGIDKERTLYTDSARVADINGDVMTTELRQVGIDKERTLFSDSTQVSDVHNQFVATELRHDGIHYERTIALDCARVANTNSQLMVTNSNDAVGVSNDCQLENTKMDETRYDQASVLCEKCERVKVVKSKSQRSLPMNNVCIHCLSVETYIKIDNLEAGLKSCLKATKQSIFRHDQNHVFNEFLLTNVTRPVSVIYASSENSDRRSLFEQYNYLNWSEFTNFYTTLIEINSRCALDTKFSKVLDNLRGSLSMERRPFLEHLLNGTTETGILQYFDGTLVRSDRYLNEMIEYNRKNGLALNVITSMFFSAARYSSELYHTKIAFSAIHLSEYRMPIYIPVALDGLINQKDQRDRMDHLISDRCVMYSSAFCDSFGHIRERAFIYEGNPNGIITYTDIDGDWRGEDCDSDSIL